MLAELNYTAAEVSQRAIRQCRLELRGDDLPVAGIYPPGKLQQIFDDYLDYLENNLILKATLTDIGQVQEMLLELSNCIRSNSSRIKPQEYNAILERLSGIYTQGMAQNRKGIYSATAAHYADLIEAISLKNPVYDYSKMIGQLLFYMNQLFEQRKGSWITIYDHIRSMPDSIEVLQSLKNNHFLEIQQRVEEGVENLFQIHGDLYSRIAQLNLEIHELDQKLNEGKANLSSGIADFAAEGETTIISLELKRREREVHMLAGKLNGLIDKREGKKKILELIEENIKEFEDLLANTRRTISIELIYDSAQQYDWPGSLYAQYPPVRIGW